MSTARFPTVIIIGSGLIATLGSLAHVERRAAVLGSGGDFVMEFRGWPHFYAVALDDKTGTHRTEVAKHLQIIRDFTLDNQLPVTTSSGAWSLLWFFINWLLFSVTALLALFAITLIRASRNPLPYWQ